MHNFKMLLHGAKALVCIEAILKWHLCLPGTGCLPIAKIRLYSIP